MRMKAPLEIGISCRSIDRLLPFYVNLLGCEQIDIIDVSAEKAQKAAVAQTGYRVARVQTPWGERLKFIEPAQEPADTVIGKYVTDRSSTIYVTFIVDDLRAIFNLLKDNNVTVMTGPDIVIVRPGTSLIFTRDPEDNIVEFVEYEDLSSYRPDLIRPDRQVPKSSSSL